MTLVSQKALSSPKENGPAWHGEVYSDLKMRLSTPSNFPCTFSINAFRRGLIEFSFVETLDLDGVNESVADLRAYVESAFRWDGDLSTAQPLIVAFSPKLAEFETLEEYQEFGWNILQTWHDNDSRPWPDDVATDPNRPFWTMCFHGMQIFVNMSCPRHVIRRSRNLGNHFLFIINPRERFDLVAGNNVEGRKTRQFIRNRILAYDGQSHCLQLGSYQEGELEWSQYGIIEENTSRTDRCPFRVERQ